MCHLMKKLAVDDGSSVVDKDQVKHKTQSHFQGLVTLFTHAHICIDNDCKVDHCCGMKNVIAHIPVCGSKTRKECMICKKAIKICYYHTKNCLNENCNVVLCSALKKFIRKSLKI